MEIIEVMNVLINTLRNVIKYCAILVRPSPNIIVSLRFWNSMQEASNGRKKTPKPNELKTLVSQVLNLYNRGTRHHVNNFLWFLSQAFLAGGEKKSLAELPTTNWVRLLYGR